MFFGLVISVGRRIYLCTSVRYWAKENCIVYYWPIKTLQTVFLNGLKRDPYAIETTTQQGSL